MQWTDPQQVIAWFSDLDQKGNLEFLKFDVKEFYPSITEELLNKSIRFAKKYHNITKEEERIIENASQSVLHHDGQVWIKNKDHGSPTFDITMGGYHGAEVCELVGLYMLNEISKFVPKQNIGLYRDDGLMVIKKQRGQRTEKLKQRLHGFAKSIGLSFEIEGPMTKTDFLDVKLDLDNQIYAPYRKENNEIKYIKTTSNHPRSIINQIPKMIGKRISKRSSNKEEFEKVANDYNVALKKSGYKEKIEYSEEPAQSHKRKRKRKIIWFNPPFCRTVKTRLKREFILLIEKHFDKTNALSKIFNKNTIKLSYSCMQNVGNAIKAHNRKTLNKGKDDSTPTPLCNCRKFDCPLKDTGKSCQTESVIYEATVKTEKETRSYIGLTGNKFKTRYYQHRHDFATPGNKDKTELSKYIWKQKDNNIAYDLRWKIIRQVRKIENGNKTCRLCISEAAEILKGKKGQLNKRTEIMNKCRHKNKFLLKNLGDRAKKK